MIRIGLKVVGNPDPRNPEVEHGSYLAGDPLGERDYTTISRLKATHVPCRVSCPKFGLEIEAVLFKSLPYRYDGVILQTKSLMPDRLIDFVDSNPFEIVAEVTIS